MQINFNPYIIFWRKNVSSSANFFPLERVIFPDCNAAILYTLACMETEIFNTTGAPFKKALKPFAYQLFDDQNNVQNQFVDEDDFPLASITEHQASDEEFHSGASESRSEDSSEESEEEDSEVESDQENWSREVRRRVDLEFSEEPGINISTRNLKSCLDYFELFFTQEVWQLLVSQTNLYAEQKREPAESSVLYPVTECEMKAWISLYLNMGLVTKPNLNSYWSTDPVLSSPFFPFLDLVIARFQEVYTPERQLAIDEI